MARPFPLDFQPGIQRDGTRFDSNGYMDGAWCRWRLGRPRSMGGFQRITDELNGLPRRIHCWYDGSRIIAHVGTVNGIQQVIFDTFGNLISIIDRTPVGFLGGPATGFTMDAIFDTTSKVVQIIVHSVPDTGFLSTPISSVPLLGQIDASTALTQFSNPGTLTSGAVWTQPNISGGICCVQPFVFDFDSSGLLQWSAPNLPLYLGVVGGSTGAGQARVSSQKIVQGMALRGGGSQSPAALFWSLSEVITATFIGGAPTWAFNTVSPSSSILSSDAVIEYDGLYFWAGVDRFLVFNGTVTEVPNKFNQDWFFDNLTPGYEAQTYAMKVPRYGEIWFCAPMFGSTVPNYACIFNLRENCWYDTPLPTNSWSAGFYAQGFNNPIFAGWDQDGQGGVYKLWMTEIGTDEVDGASVQPIRKFYETGWFGGPKNTPPDDKGLSLADLEPDIIQTGPLEISLIGAPNARADDTVGPTLPLPQIPGSPQEQGVGFTQKQNQRLSRLHVESNVLGGSFIVGRNLMHGDPAETRRFS